MNGALWSRLFPVQARLGARELWMCALAAGFTIGLNAWLSQMLLPGDYRIFLAASMGASTILALVIYHSPLSQPWAILGGHLAGACAGLLAHTLVPSVLLASMLAMALTVLLQVGLRCLHAPGGGTALLPVLGGAAVQAEGLGFIAVVALNAVVLVLAALVFNNLLPERRYPTSFFPSKPASPPVFTTEELQAAIADMHEVIDVSPDDLEKIFELALARRHAGAK
ncbi:MAG: HPP family protein [Pseudomonadota bacterium]